MTATKNQQGQLKERRKNIRSSGSKERRHYIRTATSVPMTIHLDEAGKINHVDAVTRNISASGMRVETSKELPTNKDVKIELMPPGTLNPIHCKAGIVWCASEGKKFNTGIEFKKIEEDNKNTFLKFLCDAIYKSASNE